MSGSWIPGVPLLFHGASMYRRGDLTAAECGALHSKLLKANERMISRLVDRAIAGPLIEVEHAAEPSDRDVVEALCVGAAPDPGGSAPARVQTLATALGQTVDEAVRERDRKTLAHIYQRLFEIDRPISGKLTRTLRLVDRVGTPDAGARGNLDHLSITVPASPGLYLSADKLPPEALLRHVLVLGDDRAPPPACAWHRWSLLLPGRVAARWARCSSSIPILHSGRSSSPWPVTGSSCSTRTASFST